MVVPDNKQLKYLSWITLIGMSGIGFLLIYFGQQRDVVAVLQTGKKFQVQLAAGTFFGSLAALLGFALIQIRRFKATRFFFQELVAGINPSLWQIIFYSLCAGVGEEILFRAGIQPLIGIWPTAIVFVLMHGYLNPGNLNLTIYGMFLIIISAGFGYLFKYFGLASAMVAHFLYDVAMFSMLKYSGRNGQLAQVP